MVLFSLKKEKEERKMRMKSTGIVRKIDELGRITLPIEIRRIMDIEQKVKAIADSADELKKSQNTILNEEIRKKENKRKMRGNE